jgi:predicted nucleic acid-binding protein
MTPVLVLDTDVVIDYLRGRSEAVAWLQELKSPAYLSVITISELYAGVRDGREGDVLDDFIDSFGKVEITREIARRGGLFRRDYRSSHNTGLADALIAASAQSIDAVLITFNTKHFPMLERVRAPYVKN